MLGGRFRFLASVSAGQRATLAQGAPGVTLAAVQCRRSGVARLPAIYAPGLTMFWEGFVTDLRGCIPLEVRASPASPPVRVTVAPDGGSCASMTRWPVPVLPPRVAGAGARSLLPRAAVR